MKRTVIAAAVIGLVASGAGLVAAGESDQPGDDRLAAVRRMFQEAKYAEAAGGARALAAAARDDKTKTEAMRILAEALRKDGQWRPAARAYSDLKEMFEKGTLTYVRCEATAEVLQASPKGVYGKSDGAATPGATSRTLADDTGLAEALAQLGEAKAAKVKRDFEGVRKFRSGPEVASKLANSVAQVCQARMLAPGLPADIECGMAAQAGETLERLKNEDAAGARKRLSAIEQDALVRHTISAADRKTVAECFDWASQMRAAEEQFIDTVEKIERPMWADRMRVRTAAFRRRMGYLELAQTCMRLQRPGLN